MGQVLAITGAAAELGKGLVGIAVFWIIVDGRQYLEVKVSTV